MTASWRASAALWVVLIAGCPTDSPFGEEEEEGLPDGSQCEEDSQCKSRGCLHAKLCGPSYCTCPGEGCPEGGEPSSDCSDNAVCVYYEDIFESFGEVFNVEHDMNGGYCRALCEKGCPEHFVCGGDGRYCEPDREWAAPVPTIEWSGAAMGMLSGRSGQSSAQIEYGEPVTVTGSATSPLGKDVILEWNIVTSHEQMRTQSESVTVSVEPGLSYTRVELYATDDEGRGALIEVSFDGCSGSGTQCGYEGSGCCNGCDRDANTCM